MPHTELPPGIARCNPFNLEYDKAIHWNGQIVPTDGSPYLRFVDALHGLRAGMKDARFKAYERGLNTLSKLIPAFAPAADGNDVAAYVADVAKRLGIAPNAPLDLSTADTLTAYSSAIVTHENGHCPSGDWYERATYLEAAKLALTA